MTTIPDPEVSPTSLRYGKHIHFGANNIHRLLQFHSDCVICMEAIIENSMFLECAHEFHKDCIDRWFALKETCPVCRYNHAEATNKPETSPAAFSVSVTAPIVVTPRQEAVQNRRRSRRRSRSSRPSSSRSRSGIRRSRSRRR